MAPHRGGAAILAVLVGLWLLGYALPAVAEKAKQAGLGVQIDQVIEIINPELPLYLKDKSIFDTGRTLWTYDNPALPETRRNLGLGWLLDIYTVYPAMADQIKLSVWCGSPGHPFTPQMIKSTFTAAKGIERLILQQKASFSFYKNWRRVVVGKGYVAEIIDGVYVSRSMAVLNDQYVFVFEIRPERPDDREDLEEDAEEEAAEQKQ